MGMGRDLRRRTLAAAALPGCDGDLAGHCVWVQGSTAVRLAACVRQKMLHGPVAESQRRRRRRMVGSIRAAA